MDEEEQRFGDSSDTLNQGTQMVKNTAGNAVNKATSAVKGKASEIGNRAKSNIASAVKEKITGKPQERQKLIVGPVSIARGKMYAAKGQAEKAVGQAQSAMGDATHAIGTATRANAAAIRATGNLLGAALAATGAGGAIKSSADALANNMNQKGINMQAKGVKQREAGYNKIRNANHNIKRGLTLAQTGKDIGSKESSNTNNAIPSGIPSMPNKPNIKEIAKEAVKTKLPKIIILIIVIALIVSFMFAFVFLITTEVKEGKNNEGDNSNVPYVVTSKILKNIVLDKNDSGELEFFVQDEDGNKLYIDQALDDVLDTLKDNNASAYEDLGKNKKQRKEFLKLLIQAEIATQFPDISNGTNRNEVEINNGKITVGDTLSGNVKLQRKDSYGNVTDLKFISQDQFNQMITSGDSNVMNYYTLRKGTTGSSSSSTIVSGDNNIEKVWNFLVGKGYSDEAAAATIGNLMYESGGGPNDIKLNAVEQGNNNEGIGMVQWSYGRKSAFLSFLASKGESWPNDNVATQCEYMLYELENGQWIWTSNGQEYGGQYNISLDEFRTSGNIAEATTSFCAKFERCHLVHSGITTRISYAQSVYNTYHGNGVSSSSASSSSTKKSSTNSSSSSSSSSSKKQSSSNTDEESSDSKSVKSFDNFLFIGDSRYNGIATQLQALGNNVTAIGVDSSTSSEWQPVTNSGSGTIKGRSISLPEEADGVSVMLGVNDLSTSNTQKVLENLHSRYPDAKIYYNSVYHVSSSYSSGSVNASNMNANIDTFNNTMKSFCDENSWAEYIDVTSSLNDENGYLKNADSAGIHLTAGEGQTQLVTNIKNKIIGTTSGLVTSSSSTNGGSTYVIVVANYSTQSIYSVDSYGEYLYSQAYSTNGGSAGTASRFSSSPADEVRQNTSSTMYTTSCIDYQAALKDHTLYFDFLWALFVNSRDRDLVTNLAALAIQTDIDITEYSQVQTVSNTTTSDSGTKTVRNLQGTTVYEDTYRRLNTTTSTSTTVTSKLAITNADTWLLKYENDADNYEEYQAKTKEVVTEKSSDDDEIMKLLRADKTKLNDLYHGAYLVGRMIEDNEKVAFMYDIYQYVLNMALKNKSNYNSIQDLVNIGSFDIATFSSSFGSASGDGGVGGGEENVSGDGYNNIFNVGTRTYKNYKQMQGSWSGSSLAGFPGTTLSRSGCAINSIAVMLSGYGIDMTPGDVNEYAKSTTTPTCHDITLQSLLGKKVSHHMSGNFPLIIQEQLKSGKPCMVRSSFYSSSHYFCILAISEDGTQVYVSDVGGEYVGQGRDGWQPVSFLSRINLEVFTVDE